MKFNLLVVDDEKNIRAGLGKSLELDGYNVLLAAQGREALDLVESNEIDLIIADLRMPVMSGEQLLKSMTASYPSIPVIILTGHGSIESAVNSMRDGAYDYLLKPINVEEMAVLTERIAEVLALRRDNAQLTQNFEEHVEQATRDMRRELGRDPVPR